MRVRVAGVCSAHSVVNVGSVCTCVSGYKISVLRWCARAPRVYMRADFANGRNIITFRDCAHIYSRMRFSANVCLCMRVCVCC